jgi:alkylmercury lyase-like protein
MEEEDMRDSVDEQDVRVRAAVYDSAMLSGIPPSILDLSRQLALPREDVLGSLERLATAKALVLQPESREILMANPFSAVPTPFAVHAGGRLYYGNCIWDALGIPAMLGCDATLQSSCACCGEAMRLAVTNGGLEPVDGVVHFAIPAKQWWQDIVFN